MDKYEITNRIEKFAPLETQEAWDCSGWGVNVLGHNEVFKVMLCLTVTDDIIKQAKEQNCDMIISHHPLFEVPIAWKDINIYCSHTNMDLANGGTTDVLINSLNLKVSESNSFLRYVDIEISVEDFVRQLRKSFPNMRYVNNRNTKILKRIAFCAGSGSEFINDAFENGADAYVTGDLKFHTALESPLVLFDVGHFESEIMILDVFKELVGSGVEVFVADERSPFIY